MIVFSWIVFGGYTFYDFVYIANKKPCFFAGIISYVCYIFASCILNCLSYIRGNICCYRVLHIYT
ncbi:hypothetical protein HanRHA438_Chr03g0110071 [Helianthus annuus]|nr:hypothetical protein HanRHA438_Chr03g0110071 [Helianthus annuus]